ncbi:MAG: ABC transporter permease [Sphaerochaetaceae bacterium]|jgi:oligopeptide transport system permease protein|nr:ABC transporter permease [Sphaerochaetaceae bacterium]MDD2404990.1 ABC transporter permease [Sphaerochaetaceae bacterium]MDD3671327.1 ABC transporter permease [Sphaerochaetaceae bacterium]MDD4260259.1 ABC transporter permease [Sphaerochaetaceae bacterium]MDD4762506.1 ABC transporter permease [Sphaerochaetaceae bacterium]
MGKYVVKRFLSMLLTMFIIATLTFFLMNAVPGDPFALERDTPEVIRQSLEQKYGLDKPLMERYVVYLANILKGDFGMSMKFKGQSVVGTVQRTMPISAIVGLGGVLIGVIVGVIFGIIAAIKNKGTFDYLVIIIAILGVSIPNFVFATMFQRLFAVELRLLPAAGYRGFKYLVLPIFAASMQNIAFYARMLRSSMLDVLNQDYIVTARSKGLTKKTIIIRHTLRNSILPLVTSFGPMLAGVLTGNFVIERIFGIPGIGQSMIGAIQSSDYMMIMGLTILFSFITILMYFIVDILYGIVDPRIRVAK